MKLASVNSLDPPQRRRGETRGESPVGAYCLLAAALYFLAQALIRILVGGSLELDEAEQLVLTQSLELGYGIQPPLYVWLQWLVFQITGPSILGLALLKQTLLFAGLVFFYAAARRVMDSAFLAAAASAALFLVPKIAWETQRDLTHSVLVFTAAAVMLWAFLRTVQEGQGRDYLLLGLAAAACFLAKYNGLLLVASMALAAAFTPDLRRRLSPRGLGITLGVFLLVSGSHLWWLAETLLEGRLNTTDLDSGEFDWLALRIAGLYELFKALLEFAGPPLLLLVLLSGWRASRRATATVYGRFLDRLMTVELLALLAATLVFGIANLKGRWLLPLLFFLPLWLFLLWPARFDRPAAGRILVASIGMALLVLVIIPLHSTGRLGGPSDQDADFEPLATALEERLTGDCKTVVAASDWLGGNLRLLRPDWNVIVPGYPRPGEGAPCLWMWREDKPAPGGPNEVEITTVARVRLTYSHSAAVTRVDVGAATAAAHQNEL